LELPDVRLRFLVLAGRRSLARRLGLRGGERDCGDQERGPESHWFAPADFLRPHNLPFSRHGHQHLLPPPTSNSWHAGPLPAPRPRALLVTPLPPTPPPALRVPLI